MMSEHDMQTELSLDNAGEAKKGRRPDTDLRLLDLARQLEARDIVPAPFQRGTRVWSKKEKKSWLERCRLVSRGEKEPPLGTVCLYKVPKNRGVDFINDGLQRISTAMEAMDHPRQFGYERDDINDFLSDTYIHVQNRMYASHIEAAYDFDAVNRGVPLNSYERHKWILSCHPKWISFWEDEINRWQRLLELQLAGFSRFAEKRNALSTRARSFFQLLCLCHGKRILQYGNGPELEECGSPSSR